MLRIQQQAPNEVGCEHKLGGRVPKKQDFR